MKINRLYIIVLAIFSFFNGCQNKKKQIVENKGNITTVVIPQAHNTNHVDIINDLSYIILEEKDNSFFGHVTKLRVYLNRIFVLDLIYAKSLFVYTTDGKHLATIGANKGRGPLDFISVSNFEIDYANNQLLVMDNFGFKFMIYDLDGRFIKRIDSKIGVTNAVLLPNGYIMHAKASSDYEILGQTSSRLIITDDNNQIISEGFEYDDNKELRFRQDGLISSQPNGEFYFAPKFRDTIYSVSLHSITPKYAVNYGNNRTISKSVIKDMVSDRELFELLNSGNTCFMGNYVDSKDFLYLLLGIAPNAIYVFYNKQTTNTVATIQDKNRIGYERELFRLLCSDSEGYFYGAFLLTPLKEVVKLFPDLQNIDPSRDLNPVLFRYKVKI